MPSGSSDIPSFYQVAASHRLGEILERHGLGSTFHVKAGDGPALWTTFQFEGNEFSLAIFEAEINLRQGSHLYECYLRTEFADGRTRPESFASRLDRFLSGGQWRDPDEG
jgi:hypothetical protein